MAVVKYNNNGTYTQAATATVINNIAPGIVVTAADNGAVMQVVNGAWAAVHINSAESNNTYTDNQYFILGTTLADINAAILSKTGGTTNLTAAEMAEAIRSIGQ